MSETIEISIEGKGLHGRINEVHFPPVGAPVRLTVIDYDARLGEAGTTVDANGQPNRRRVYESDGAGWPGMDCDVVLFEHTRSKLERMFGKRNLSQAQLETIRICLAKIQHTFDGAPEAARRSAA